MRKVILQEWISLDGYAADQNGTTDFFSSPKYNEGSDQDQLSFMERIDTILLGSNTYKMFSEYWPDADPKAEMIATRLNETSKIVFSTTLIQAPWGKWQDCQIESDLENTVRRLKLQEGKDMVLWGSLSIAQSLIEAGLVDEYQLRIVPILLSAGRPMFLTSKGPELNLQLMTSKVYQSGIILLVYRSVQ